jgi:hypothetical protein
MAGGGMPTMGNGFESFGNQMPAYGLGGTVNMASGGWFNGAVSGIGSALGKAVEKIKADEAAAEIKAAEEAKAAAKPMSDYRYQEPSATSAQPIGLSTYNLGPTLYQQKKLASMPPAGIGGYAQGGMPRFLSGGGDGMSDSIHASIDGHQEARLADGEFVIPADVVSHLGNGSSKAGAKQLHAMMDRVRKARTGNPKQGKQINPMKFMPA